jgi:hypothetical protein
MYYWHKGNPINLQATIDPGANQTVEEIKWTMNGTVIPTIPLQQQITIDTTQLTGEYKIGVTAKNSCGSVSNEYYKTFFITEVNMIKEITVTVNQPIVNVTVVMDLTGTINITVTDPLNQPIQGATVQIIALNMTATTDATGKATLTNVPYSTPTVKITTP